MKKKYQPYGLKLGRRLGVVCVIFFLFLSPLAFIDITTQGIGCSQNCGMRQPVHYEKIISDQSFTNTTSHYHHIEVSPVAHTNDMGVWVHTKYDGITDSVKLDIGIEKFILMLNGGGWVTYKLSMEKTDDTTINLRFVRTKIFLDDGTEVDVIETNFNVDSPLDTTKSFEVSLEIRFPFSLIEKTNKLSSLLLLLSHQYHFLQSLGRIYEITHFPFLHNLVVFLEHIYEYCKDIILSPFFLGSQSYFCVRLGYASPADSTGPTKVNTQFFFGRKNLFDPQVFRMKISPQDLDKHYPLTYFNSYLTVDTSGTEAFYRDFSMEFSPAAELQITSIPRQAVVQYDFGNSAGVATRISFQSRGGAFTDIIQSFLIDPLPAQMSFDLTVLGERSFTYESDQRYSVTYCVDSQRNDTLVALELQDLPTRMTVGWGLDLNLRAQTGSGFIDLDMSHNIGAVTLSVPGCSSPFFKINDFPQALRLEGYMDVPHLKGHLRASKYSGTPTTLSVPLSFEQWRVTSSLKLKDGYVNLFWDLPTTNDTSVALGLDTNNNAMLASELSLLDTETNIRMLSLSFDGLATDDLALSWRFDDAGKIRDFQWGGKVSKLIDLYAMVTYKNISLSFSGSWVLGQSGSFELEFSLPVSVTFVDISDDQFKLAGSLSLYQDRYLKIDWELDQTGYFTIFTPEPLGESLFLELGYNYGFEQQEYQYGVRINATDFLVITKTLQWDTLNGAVPRIWVLGDDPLPGNWQVDILWNYEWYEVTST